MKSASLSTNAWVYWRKKKVFPVWVWLNIPYQIVKEKLTDLRLVSRGTEAYCCQRDKVKILHAHIHIVRKRLAVSLKSSSLSVNAEVRLHVTTTVRPLQGIRTRQLRFNRVVLQYRIYSKIFVFPCLKVGKEPTLSISTILNNQHQPVGYRENLVPITKYLKQTKAWSLTWAWHAPLTRTFEALTEYYVCRFHSWDRSSDKHFSSGVWSNYVQKTVQTLLIWHGEQRWLLWDMLRGFN